MTEDQRFLSQARAYGPERLTVLRTAFDSAWQVIQGNFGSAPEDLEAARTVLANIFISLPRGEDDDAESIKTAALQVMALGYRDRAQDKRSA